MVLAFKLWADKFVGKLVFIRVYAGVLKKGDTVYNPRTRKTERVGRSSRSRLTSTRTLTPYTPATSPPSWACAT